MAKQLIPAVGYVRMSTDQQGDSPERQRGDATRIAAQNNCKIVDYYDDHGLTGTESANRPEFQRLLADARAGKFKVLIVSELSRLSREDPMDAIAHFKILREAGVRILTGQGEIRFDDVGGLVTWLVSQWGAHDESRKLASRVVSGHRLAIQKGKRMGGRVFAYDREIRDEKGDVVKVVNFREKFKKPRTWTSCLVWSKETEAVEAVQYAFQAAMLGQSINSLANEFNRRKLTTISDKPFSISSMKGLLTNPTYAGLNRFGGAANGKFARVVESGEIIVDGQHESMVNARVFEQVQEILKHRQKTYTPKSPEHYLLSGLLVCGNCGRSMSGCRYDMANGELRRYQCVSVSDYRLDCAGKPHIPRDVLEAKVLEAVKAVLVEPSVEKVLRDAIARHRSESDDAASAEERQLIALQNDLELANVNLARAESDEDFQRVSTQITEWEDRESKLLEKIKVRDEAIKPIPDALRALERFTEAAGTLSTAERPKLAVALMMTIDAIKIESVRPEEGDVTYRNLRGEIHFKRSLCDAPVLLSDSDIGPKKMWLEVAQFVRAADRVVRGKEVKEQFGFSSIGLANYHLLKAERAALVRRLGPGRGWQSTAKTSA